MSIIIKELSGGGDLAVKRMMETASVLGTDLIELLWIPANGSPRFDPAQIVGYKYPVVGNLENFDGDIKAEAWVDDTLMFYPDAHGRCWGYIFDIPENRELLYSSLSNGWYRVSDTKIREEIKKEAAEKNFNTDIAQKTEVNTKKTLREQNAEKKAQNLLKELEDMKKREEILRKELSEAKNERKVHVEKRLQGTPIPSGEELMYKEK